MSRIARTVSAFTIFLLEMFRNYYICVVCLMLLLCCFPRILRTLTLLVWGTRSESIGSSETIVSEKRQPRLVPSKPSPECQIKCSSIRSTKLHNCWNSIRTLLTLQWCTRMTGGTKHTSCCHDFCIMRHRIRIAIHMCMLTNRTHPIERQCLTHPIERQCCLLCVLYMWHSVWDVEEGTRLVAQYNSQARITAAEFLNPHDISFLLTGSGKVSPWVGLLLIGTSCKELFCVRWWISSCLEGLRQWKAISSYSMESPDRHATYF